MSVKIKIHKRPKGGLIAEADVSQPHAEVPEDGAEIYVSKELAHRLVLSERAEYVRDASEDEDLEAFTREDEDEPGDEDMLALMGKATV